MNLDSEIAKIDKGSPYLIMLTSEEGQQLFVVVERALLAESGNITTAVVNLVALYFSFDIVYPQPLYAVLIFIQHLYLVLLTSKRYRTVPLYYLAHSLRSLFNTVKALICTPCNHLSKSSIYSMG